MLKSKDREFVAYFIFCLVSEHDKYFRDLICLSANSATPLHPMHQ